MRYGLIFTAVLMFCGLSVAALDSQEARAIQAHYGSMPKGVMLEGVAEGIDPITSIDYDKERNALILNGNMIMPLTVTRKQFTELLRELAKDDRIGVSLTKTKEITFGAFPSESDMAQVMFETDKLLCRVIFGFNDMLEGVKLPGGYVPKQAANRPTTVAAYILFYGFQYAKKGNEYISGGCAMNVELYPTMSAKGVRAEDGGHVIDEDALAKGMLAAEDRANRDHIIAHAGEYKQMPVVNKVIQYGMAAAIARSVRDSKVDTTALLKKMR